VREALHRLAAAGYVRIQRGRNGGAYVLVSWGAHSAEMIRRTLVPNWDHFEALFDLRRLVEPLIARTAAERRTDDDLLRIDQAVEDYAAAPDREASRAADQAIHAAVARATQNVYLETISGQIRAQVSLGFQAEAYTPAIRQTAIGQHRQIADAIRAGAAETAAELARAHFSLTETALRDLVERVRQQPGRQSRANVTRPAD
jgi:DNA-binding FadR family transcriptional regulator